MNLPNFSFLLNVRTKHQKIDIPRNSINDYQHIQQTEWLYASKCCYYIKKKVKIMQICRLIMCLQHPTYHMTV